MSPEGLLYARLLDEELSMRNLKLVQSRGNVCPLLQGPPVWDTRSVLEEVEVGLCQALSPSGHPFWSSRLCFPPLLLFSLPLWGYASTSFKT